MKALTLIALILHLVSLKAFACFPKNVESSFDIPPRYAHLPSELLDVLRKSYLRHTKENLYLDNAFWGTNPDDKCSWPDSLWGALDKLGPKAIYTLASVYQKTHKAYVWSTVGHIRNIWFGTSFGMTFDSADKKLEDMITYIKSKGTFCKDSEAISKKEHNGQICWRQIPKDKDGAGLHFCFGAGRPPEVHIDHHQVAMGRLPFSELCLYDPIAVYKHYKDLKGSAPKTIFDYLDEEAKELQRLQRNSELYCQGFEKHIFQLNMERMLTRLSPDKITAIATLGEGSRKAGLDLLEKISKEKEQLFRFASCGCQEP